MQAIKYAYLDNNYIQALPSSISQLQRLKVLNLSCNRALNSIPNTLSELGKLE